MSNGLCPSCGATINIPEGVNEVQCEYCKTLVKNEEATHEFEEFKKSPQGGLIMLADTAQKVGKFDEAINYYNRVIEMFPTFADVWLSKGVCLIEIPRNTKLIAQLMLETSEENQHIKRQLEAIECWNNALKYAKNAEAMKKRIVHIICKKLECIRNPKSIINRFKGYEEFDHLYKYLGQISPEEFLEVKEKTEEALKQAEEALKKREKEKQKNIKKKEIEIEKGAVSSSSGCAIGCFSIIAIILIMAAIGAGTNSEDSGAFVAMAIFSIIAALCFYAYKRIAKSNLEKKKESLECESENSHK